MPCSVDNLGKYNQKKVQLYTTIKEYNSAGYSEYYGNITGMAVQNRPEYSTYHEDVAAVKDSFKKMLENGVYKADLFSDL